MTQIIDLSRLPAPALVQTLDYDQLLMGAVTKFRELLPEFSALLESDPAIKVLEVYAYLDLLLRGRINDAARALLLAYAVGSDLDQLAAQIGIQRLADETDTRLRTRTQQGFWQVAAAGPANAYRAHAMAVSTLIDEVCAYSPSPGRVDVIVQGVEWKLVSDATHDERIIGAALFPDRLPPQSSQVPTLASIGSDLLLAVADRLSADDVRPLTDDVHVRPPTVLQVTLSVVLHLYPGPDAALVIAQAETRLNGYLASIRRPGYDLSRSGLLAALHAPGVQSVEMASPPADIPAAADELALVVHRSITVHSDRDW